ncbi:hypothetical protein BDM02DRAFT_3177981 [Thelephora ganbajun]|uniref:Uncharacterized protein n=1 Tax=Thelephora ganbajun TaxID=370292 RepID=A0ACB6ZT93_THEGA|nr:hypothetical protein BDM02DRAFT_3177981 [Thelephora ganbajun]
MSPPKYMVSFIHLEPKPKAPGPGPSTGGQAQPSAKKTMTIAGQANGKRTLSEALEMDANAKKRRKSNENNKSCEEMRAVTSKFFSTPRKTSPRDGKAPDSLSGTIPGMVKRGGVVEMIDLTLDGDEPESHEIVQEDGYISPTHSSYRFETPEVSTPHRHSRMSKSGVGQEDDDDFDAELLSSPVEGRRHGGKTSKRMHEVDLDRKYSEWTINGDDIDSGGDGPDLRRSFEDADDLPSDIDCPGPGSSFASTATTSSAGPITPTHSTSLDDVEDFLEEIEDDRARIARTGSISDGWMKRWSYSGLEIKKTPVRRTETTVTGDNGRRQSYQERSEAKVGMGSSGMTPIPKRIGTELKGRPEDEFGIGDDIYDDDDEGRSSQAGAWLGIEGRRVLR